MPASFSLTLHFPLPRSLHPTLVIQTLHAHEPLIVPNPYLQSFRRLPVDMDDVVADPFFRDEDKDSDSHQDTNTMASYEIHDRIPVVGFLGIHKDTVFPAIFQNTPRGVKVKVEAAAGVKVRSIYEVVSHSASAQENAFQQQQQQQQQQQHYHQAGGMPGEGDTNDHAWELVERSQVECGALLKPFVMKSFEAGHRDLCRKVLDNIEAAQNAPSGAQQGRRPLTADKDLPPLPVE